MIGLRATQTLRTVFSGDPAIDQGIDAEGKPISDMAKFGETGDIACLRWVSGEEPTYFELRRVTARAFNFAMGQTSQPLKERELIAYGLAAVENLRGRDGNPVKLKHVKSHLGPRLTDEALDEIHSVELFDELAVRLWRLSTLDPTIGRG